MVVFYGGGMDRLHHNQVLHEIPLADAMIGIYAAYYIGEKGHEVKDRLNVTFNKRAMNSYNMDAALKAGFGQEDSPWVMLADSSAPRVTEKAERARQHGGHFIAMYHKKSRQVMIALPGMEYDFSLQDTVDDAKELILGSKRQSAALHEFTKEIEHKIADGAFIGPDGLPLPIAGARPVIGSHSMGCLPAQVMGAQGYNTILVEPRPIHYGLLRRIGDIVGSLTGQRPTQEDMLGQLDAGCISLRARHANVWNSVLLPWVKEKRVGLNFTYGDEKPAKLIDRFITAFHAAEVAVPSLMNTKEARQAPKFRRGVTLLPDEPAPKGKNFSPQAQV